MDLKKILSSNNQKTENTIVDAIYSWSKWINTKSKDPYFLLTRHKPSNTDSQKNFKIIIKTINKLFEKEKIKCIFPIHSRLNPKKEFTSKFKNILVIEFLECFALLNLQKHSKRIFTDSEEIQKEPCILKKKCVMLKTNTKRSKTVKIKEVILLKPITKEEILKQYNQLIKKKII